MNMKATIDDLFEKADDDLQAALERLQLWEQRLRFLLGMAVMWVLLVPEVFDNSGDIAYAPLIWLLLLGVPAAFAFYLLLWPSWRWVPITARRSAIVRAATISLLTFGSLALILGIYPTGGYPALTFLLMAGIGAYGLHRLNTRWQEPDAGELFP